MSTDADQFRSLAHELAPIDAEAGKIKIRMMALSHKMSLDTLREAYPSARIVTMKAFTDVKPSNFGRAATEAIASLNEHGLNPTLIIVDETRMLITIGEEVLPPAANLPNGIKASRKPRNRK